MCKQQLMPMHEYSTPAPYTYSPPGGYTPYPQPPPYTPYPMPPPSTPVPTGANSNVYFYSTVGSNCTGITAELDFIPANKCHPDGRYRMTRDTNLPIINFKAICPPITYTGGCGVAKVYKGTSGCSGTAETQEFPCNKCMGDDEGFSILSCNFTSKTIAYKSNCNSACSSCKNTTALSLNTCTKSEGEYILPVSLGNCTTKFIEFQTFVRLNGFRDWQLHD
jgi:hypothetical protein